MGIKDFLWVAPLELSLDPPPSREISMVKLEYGCSLRVAQIPFYEVIS
jgi:hypothetical protein